MRKNNTFAILLGIFFFNGFFHPLFAAGADLTDYVDRAFIIFFLFLIFILVIFMLSLNRKPGEKLGLAAAFRSVIQKISGTKPVEEEKDLLLDHDYNGIRELDNSLPPWWKWLFYITIIFSVVYMLHYHVFNTGPTSDAEYIQEIAVANQQRAEFLRTNNVVTVDNVTVLTDAAALFAGSETFKKNCVQCHGQFGEGKVGPNLTDKYWINGGSIKDIFRTISEGVPAKGMITWKNQLTPSQIQESASYVLSLQGTNPANPKPVEPNAVLYNPAPPSTDSTKVTTPIGSNTSVKDSVSTVQSKDAPPKQL